MWLRNLIQNHVLTNLTFVLILFMGAVVLIIVLAIMLPILNMSNLVG